MRSYFLAWSFSLAALPALPGVARAGSGAPEPAPAPPAPASMPVLAPASQPMPLYQTVVHIQTAPPAATAERITERAIELQPRTSPTRVLELAPGLITAQHQGGGKADQLFLRGFDADHGTDVALFLDGVPINLPTNAHGQGYSDLHFLIPETLQYIDVTKGPYYVEYGDFDTAGAVNLATRDAFPGNESQVTVGSFDTYRVLNIGSFSGGSSDTWVAAEAYGTNGPFDHPEDLLRYNVQGKETWRMTPAATLSIFFSGYGSHWNSSGQIPLRAVEDEVLDRFGSIDPSEGGLTQRQMVDVSLRSSDGAGGDAWAHLYVVRYHLSLYNDFTFQLRDPLHYDEIEQDDSRTYSGFEARRTLRRELFGRPLAIEIGASGRLDDTRAQLWHDQGRARLDDCLINGFPDNPCVDANDVQSDLASYAKADYRPSDRLRLVLGVRADLFEWDVSDDKASDIASGRQLAGEAQTAIVSPKLNASFRLARETFVYADLGTGFHSNDARDVVSDPGLRTLPRAIGGEVGVRTQLFDRLLLSAALWDLYLQEELVYDGDTGTIAPAPPTNRYGVDLEARAKILPWLWSDVEVNLDRALYTQNAGNGNAVALAPLETVVGGLQALHPSGIYGAVRVVQVGSRPADPMNLLQAQGYMVWDAILGWRFRHVDLGLQLENLFDTQWREAQFENQSRLASLLGEGPAGVNDIHFTPGNPFNVLTTLALRY